MTLRSSLAILLVVTACDEPSGQMVVADSCVDVEPECPPGTSPRSVRAAQEDEGAVEITLRDLGIIGHDTKVFIRIEAPSGCEYACVQDIICPPATQTCLHNGCFACIGESSDYCANCVEF